MCDLKNSFLFEVLPDFFPQKRLTKLELGLWDKYYKQKYASQ
jgi:hypothetical protein